MCVIRHWNKKCLELSMCSDVGLKTLVDGCRTYAGTYVRRPQIETAVHILFILRSSETFINERELGEKRFTFTTTFQCGILKAGFYPIYFPIFDK